MSFRLFQAKRLIETTGDKVAVIAAQVGYTQVNNFYVHFKEYYGFSPTALRDTGETPSEAEQNAEVSGAAEMPGGADVRESGAAEAPGGAGARESEEGENGGAHGKR